MPQFSVDKRPVLGVSNELAARIQTKRVSGTGTGGVLGVAINWDLAFADTNYTCVYSIQMLTGTTPVDDGIVSLTASGVQIAVNIPGAYQFVIHAIAIHD